MRTNLVEFGHQKYPLGHLRGLRVIVPARNPLSVSALLQVTYSCHVYSEKWNDSRHTEDHRIEENGGVRAFCPVRYGCSISLPDLIRYHVGGKAYEGRDHKGAKNYFFYAEADGVPYPIYFRLGRATNIRGADGLLHVISAYQKPTLQARNKLQSIRFAKLVHRKCPPKRTY